MTILRLKQEANLNIKKSTKNINQNLFWKLTEAVIVTKHTLWMG